LNSAADAGSENDPGPLTREDGLSFFVTSRTHPTGNLGGLAGADATCTELATAVGAGDHVWKAYLSSSGENARDRIGAGPWFNARSIQVAATVAALHALQGDAELFIDERGVKIDGQWNSVTPNQHDILTGSAADGTLAPPDTMGRSANCEDWTSNGTDAFAQVGHSDGMGPMMAQDPVFYTSWNSSHANQDCSNTAPRGGAGRFYCFASGRK